MRLRKACLRRLQTCANGVSGGQRCEQPASAGFLADHREAIRARLQPPALRSVLSLVMCTTPSTAPERPPLRLARSATKPADAGCQSLPSLPRHPQ